MCFLYIDTYPRRCWTWGLLHDQENIVIWLDSGREHHMEEEVLLVTPLWRARREGEFAEGRAREQGGGDLLSCYESWEEGKEKPGCNKASPQRVSSWKPFCQTFPQKGNYALWGRVMGNILSLTEDLLRLLDLLHLSTSAAIIRWPRHRDGYWGHGRVCTRLSLRSQSWRYLWRDQTYTETCTILLV